MDGALGPPATGKLAGFAARPMIISTAASRGAGISCHGLRLRRRLPSVSPPAQPARSAPARPSTLGYPPTGPEVQMVVIATTPDSITVVRRL